jgi:hypothetical protein
MDKMSTFYLDCLKLRSGLSQKVIPGVKLKDFFKVTQSDEYNATLNSGNIFIAEGQVEGTWVAVSCEPIDEETFDEIELVFECKPTIQIVRFIQFILSIEDYLSDPLLKPFVDVDGVRTHWTLLPYESVEEKWEQFILMRDEQEEKKKQNKKKR